MNQKISESNYRSRVHAAIRTLPSNERQVIELLLQGYRIDSEDESVITIAKILSCSEKTVRNRRDRAVATVLRMLKEEEDQ